MDIQFYPDTHTYKVEGVRFDGVTDVLKETGIIPPYVASSVKAARGTRVHQTIASLTRGYSLPVMPELENFITAYHQWADDAGYFPTEVEKIVADPMAQTAGTIDGLGQIYGGPGLVDWKTGAPKIGDWVQVGGYLHMAGLVRGYLVYLHEDGTYTDFKVASESIAHWQAVLVVRDLLRRARKSDLSS